MLNRALAICLLAVLACTSPDSAKPPLEEASEPSPRGAIEDPNWEGSLSKHRSDKDLEFSTSPTSPMAGAQYLKSKPGERVFLSRDEKGFLLETTPSEGNLLEVILDEGIWSWQASEQGEVSCSLGDDPLASGSVIEGSALFEIERFRLSFYGSQDRATFIVFDPERAEMLSFEHLLYYPPDPAYAVQARLEVLEPVEELVMLTSRNLEKTFYRFARVHFEIDGEQQILSAFKYALEGQDSGILFIPFRDATSGRDTYGAGRFLEIEEPTSANFLLDFNRAFNPLCNYSPAYNCAIPPKENHLSKAILAGELTYPH